MIMRPSPYSGIGLRAALAGVALVAACGSAAASFLDDNSQFSLALAVLRSAVGAHARVLNIVADADGVAIEAQDPRHHDHIDRWRYGQDTVLHAIPVKRLTGPQPVDPTLINPDLEANLFDLDAVDFSAAPKLIAAAIARAQLQDAAAVTQMEIARQSFILPKPSSGDVRWTLSISSGRERAEIHADVHGTIAGADLDGTLRAKNLDLFREPALVAQGAAAFRDVIGAEPLLTSVGIDKKTMSFATTMRDSTLGKLMTGMPATASFTWNLNGLQQRLGNIDLNAEMGVAGPPPFSIADVNWAILAKLEQDALAKVAMPRAAVSRIEVKKSTARPGGAVLAWTVEITDPDDEVTSVVADMSGAIQRVILPASRRPKVDWLQASSIAGAIARAGSIFGPDANIASIVFTDRSGRITVDEPANNGRPATFDFAGDGVTRSTMSFSFESMGPRFRGADLAPLTEQKLATLQADALKRLGGGKPVYLESVTVGAHPFVQKAGARVIEVRVRDIPQDSARAHYAWIVYDFSGRVLDFVTL